MTLFLCKLWPYLAGGLIGWLLAGWLARRLKHGESPIEKIVEKHVDGVVDNPKHLSLISKLENENSQIPGLLSQVSSLKSSNSSTRGETVDKVEKIVEVDNPKHLKKISQLEAEIRSLKSGSAADSASTGNTTTYGVASTSTAGSTQASSAPKAPLTPSATTQGGSVDLDAAKKAGFRLKQKNGQDDFTIVEGIGPKINELIHDADIHFYASLANSSVDNIQKILDDAGPRYKLAKPGTWPDQAKMAAENRWDALKKWQDELDGGQ